MDSLKTKQKWFAFTEWVGYNHIWLNGVWCHRYASQLDKKNWKTTAELYSYYNNWRIDK